MTPQNWLFLGSYKALREWMLRQVTWNVVAKLGPAAFDDMNWWAANTMLSIHTTAEPGDGHELAGLDASAEKGAARKGALLSSIGLVLVSQTEQRTRDASIISFENDASLRTLGSVSTSFRGHCNGDAPRFERRFWEIGHVGVEWEYLQGAPSGIDTFTGRESIVFWERGTGGLFQLADELRSRLKNVHVRGERAWKRRGVVIMQMNALPCAIYTGEIFDGNCGPSFPKRKCIFPRFGPTAHRHLSGSRFVNLTAKRTSRMDFSRRFPSTSERWQQVAAEEYPNGLPEPHSNDPTQWLFKGHPSGSTDPLQVAVARLLGYRWPDQEPDELDALGDNDGIVPIPSVRGEPPAAERLLELVQRAVVGRIGNPSTIAADGIASTDVGRIANPSYISPTEEGRIANPSYVAADGIASTGVGRIANPSYIYERLAEAGCRPGTSLDDWLRNSFFEQHCKRFHNRPFIWHLWDGRKDGFACLVNYHKLDHTRLESLTYSYLQDWITAQAAAAKSGQTGADLRLAAAQAMQDKLKLILAGEPPYDIFVRWKPLAEQPIGSNPDLNDGVRLNIRPFMTAGILRKNPNIKWTKDRGKEPERDKDEYPWFWNGASFVGDRVNDVHLTHAQKKAARDKAGSG